VSVAIFLGAKRGNLALVHGVRKGEFFSSPTGAHFLPANGYRLGEWFGLSHNFGGDGAETPRTHVTSTAPKAIFGRVKAQDAVVKRVKDGYVFPISHDY
jgi:hypothetical protein